MHTIVIEVSGGVVQEVYGEVEGVRVALLNWDAGESPGDAFTGGPIPLQAFSVMPPDTAQAIRILLGHRPEQHVDERSRG